MSEKPDEGKRLSEEELAIIRNDGFSTPVQKQKLLAHIDVLEADIERLDRCATNGTAEQIRLASNLAALEAENTRLAREKAEARDKAWRCFHCAEVFTNETAARCHFGS